MLADPLAPARTRSPDDNGAPIDAGWKPSPRFTETVPSIFESVTAPAFVANRATITAADTAALLLVCLKPCIAYPHCSTNTCNWLLAKAAESNKRAPLSRSALGCVCGVFTTIIGSYHAKVQARFACSEDGMISETGEI